MKLRFREKSEAPARAVAVPPGATPPKRRRAEAAGFGGKPGEVAEIGGKRRRTMLLGMQAEQGGEAAGALAVARLSALPHIALDARLLSSGEAAAMAAGALLRAWRFDRLLTRPGPAHIPPDRCRVEQIDVLCEAPDEAEAAWARLAPGVEGTLLARDLVVEPSNTLTPFGFAQRLRRLEREGLHCEVLRIEALRAEGLGALLAVGGASYNTPCLAVLRWPGRMQAAPLVLVGKGITFDTGGVCLKPAQGMWEMRADMAGAATCVGTMLALARRRSPCPAVAVLPLAENMIGAASYRPSDVLRLFDGTTVEIVDTDAEGRLVLADAIGWARARLQPRAIIDLATLTGSIVTALGHEMAGLFCNDDALAAQLAAAGAAVGDRAWRMPLTEGYRDPLTSDLADLRQCSDGSRQPDACHAAAFLSSFVGEVPWAHLDIAGVESREKADDRHPAGPTGWGVRLLDRLVATRFESLDIT